MPRKDKNKVAMELSPPHRRPGLMPDRYSPPPIIKDNEAYVEVMTSYGHRETLPQMAVFIIFTIIFIGVTLLWIDSDIDKFKKVALPALSVVIIPGILCLIGTLLTPQPLPLRLNRQTQKVYFFHKGKLYRSAWQDIRARVIVGYSPSIGYTLQFGFDRGEDEIPVWISAGTGPVAEMPLRMWEYYCQYMESGLPVKVLDDVPEEEKSEARIVNERQIANPIFRIIFYPSNMAFLTYVLLVSYLEKLSLRPARWPQEIINVCENHPLLQKKLP